jgi:tartrate dehydrogenase/decarboxylase / D-malate dehydrogenase
MRQLKIAVYPGDGIGIEVVDQAVRVLQALQERSRTFSLDLTRFPWGVKHYEQTGRVAPENFLEILRGFDAILLGAVGWPGGLADHLTLEPLIRIRQAFDQYACVRPSRLPPGVASPLAVPGASKLDLVVIRENSEGEYVNNGGRFKVGEPEEFALQTAIHTRKGVERILRYGFELARTRRRHLTMITKSNAQRYAFVLWDEILEQIRGQYTDVTADKQHVDAAIMNFVRQPEFFDVVVGSNLFGDILTDLGGLIGGGLGLAPSANINPERRFPSLFEPVHGSAPDIAGKGIANPVATILSTAMMLEWLGQDEPAGRLRRAVEATLARGVGTPDLGGTLTTAGMADEIIRTLKGN